MATHSSVLAWRIPGTGEPGGLSSMGLHRVGHDCSDLAAGAAELQHMNFFPQKKTLLIGLPQWLSETFRRQRICSFDP